MPTTKAHYIALPNDTVEEESRGLYRAEGPHSRHNSISIYFLFGVHAIATVFLVVIVYRQSYKCGESSTAPFGQAVYSPAKHALEHEIKLFKGKINSTIYQGAPSPIVDQAWLDLYNEFGISKIPKSEAKLLPNKTVPIPGDEDHYVVALSVFHQLHCLNILRQALNRDYYKDPITGYIDGVAPEQLNDHLNHCLDSIRQSLMCSSDINLIVWQWNETEKLSLPRMDTARSCRNFDRVRMWAKEHSHVHFNTSIHSQDDIVIEDFSHVD